MRAKKLAELRALEAERFVSQLETRLRVAEERIVEAEKQLQLQENQTEQKNRELINAKRWAHELEHELGKIRTLWTWKLTRPLRFLYQRIWVNYVSKKSRNWLEEAKAIEPSFDPVQYGALNPDVLQAGFEPAEHYIKYGQFQNRRLNLIEALPEPTEIQPANPDLPTLLVVCADTELFESHHVSAALIEWSAKANIVLVAFDELTQLSKTSIQSLTAFSFNKTARRSYDHATWLLEKVVARYPVDMALVYGMEAKTALAFLRTHTVPTVSFMDKKTASASSIFALQEVFFGSTYTVLEDESVRALCELVFPQLNQRYVMTCPKELSESTWLWQMLEQAMAQQKQDQIDAACLMASDEFDVSFIEVDPEKQNDKQNVVALYLRVWKAKIGMRKPMAGFHPGIYAQAMAADSLADPFAEYLRNGKPLGKWNYPLITPTTTSIKKVPTSVALHIHAYYPDMLADIVNRLCLNTVRPDLFVSVKNEADAAYAKACLDQYDGKVAALEIVPNVGRDIGPFLTAFGQRLVENYEYIGHLHTKKSWHVVERGVVEAWQHFLLSCLVGISSEVLMADRILSAMHENPRLGIVFPDDPMVLGWDRNYTFAKELAPELGVTDLPEQFNFPAGDMFWIRAEVLKKFVDLGFEWEHYPLEPLGSDGSMLHTIERLFGVVPETMGLECGVSAVQGVTR